MHLFRYAGLGGGAPLFKTWTFRGQSGAAATNTTLPAGSAAGDVAVCFNWRYTSTGGPTLAYPSGWTGAAQGSFTNVGTCVSYTILTSGDVSAGTVTGMTAGGGGTIANDIHLLVFQPSAAVTTVLCGDPEAAGLNLGGSPSWTIDAPPVAGFVCGMGASLTAAPTFSTESPTFTTMYTTTDMRTGYRIYNSAPAAHSLAFTVGGTRGGRGSLNIAAY